MGDMAMSVKNVIGFLLPLKAFSPRNLTSFGLVALFCFVYVLAGGKFETKSLDEIRRTSLNNSGFHVPVATTKNPIKITGDIKRNEKVVSKTDPANEENDALIEKSDSERDELEAIKARFDKSKKKAEER